ncbi:PREDICTED: NADH dehydrogenase [ubiquinone] 1 beta subcomplex subunit 7 [Dufourea novaeangliae]|uniref:NADH dehydrogenase [ubiquinone] 1 beta subcomplex subunit 7 n=1 Tax=Dufourea novaeangliae TaxID=178035 RepID=A0A154PA34_DUFNO|nr:PREDICTED: NADH dehydrogenase [ubiquinone] 1 beta subcomplex subunit 7 [Dufourea novaeangliae]KZC08755.1 NADH dehydrogenase [ubiquinone] 1 beta subcomplex subunit 7 [Dufourea novaeangliae]
MGNVVRPLGNWSDYPESCMPPTFDPMLGFANGRKERVMPVTDEELRAAKVPPRFRDYCADKYIDCLVCQRKHMPNLMKCKGVQHKYAECVRDDYVLRMKEYERERRLLRRQKQKEETMKETMVSA